MLVLFTTNETRRKQSINIVDKVLMYYQFLGTYYKGLCDHQFRELMLN